MSYLQHYQFETIEFERTVAHGGEREILTRRVLSSEEGSACNFIDITILESGASIGIHTHTMDTEEMYVVISGRGEMYLNGKTFHVTAGHVIVNQPGGTHGLRNCGNDDLKLVVIEVPVTASKGSP